MSEFGTIADVVCNKYLQKSRLVRIVDFDCQKWEQH